MSRHVFVVCMLAVGAFVCGVTLAGQVPLPRDAGAMNGAPVQRVPIGTAVISGSVTSAATGSPIRRAQIRLTGSSDVVSNEFARGRVAGRGAELGARGVRGGAGPAPQAAGAIVQLPLSGPGATTGGRGLPVNRLAVADAQGRFVFQNLPGWPVHAQRVSRSISHTELWREEVRPARHAHCACRWAAARVSAAHDAHGLDFRARHRRRW